MSNSEKYVKFYFYNPESKEKTAGLVLPADVLKNRTITELSRLFPRSEATKMIRMLLSPEFNTWEAAFLWEPGQ